MDFRSVKRGMDVQVEEKPRQPKTWQFTDKRKKKHKQIIVKEDDLDVLIVEEEDSITLPKIKYRKVGYIAGTEKFDGDVVPVPMVMIEYLKELELRVFSLILNYQRQGKSCIMRYKTMAVIFGCTLTSVANAIRALRDIGVINLEGVSSKKNKSVNLEAVQFLSDISKDLRPGALAMLRKLVGKKNVLELPKHIVEEVRKRFDTSDPAEFEEYD